MSLKKQLTSYGQNFWTSDSMVQFLLTPITACLTSNKNHLKLAKWSQIPSNVTSSSWNTREGAIKEMGFALSFCSSGHQSALSNNEIICWKDVHFEDHSLPKCLGHLHGSQGRFKEFLTLVTQIKGRIRCWIWFCVCVCGLIFDEASISWTQGFPCEFYFLSFN